MAAILKGDVWKFNRCSAILEGSVRSRRFGGVLVNLELKQTCAALRGPTLIKVWRRMKDISLNILRLAVRNYYAFEVTVFSNEAATFRCLQLPISHHRFMIVTSELPIICSLFFIHPRNAPPEGT